MHRRATVGVGGGVDSLHQQQQLPSQQQQHQPQPRQYAMRASTPATEFNTTRNMSFNQTHLNKTLIKAKNDGIQSADNDGDSTANDILSKSFPDMTLPNGLIVVWVLTSILNFICGYFFSFSTWAIPLNRLVNLFLQGSTTNNNLINNASHNLQNPFIHNNNIATSNIVSPLYKLVTQHTQQPIVRYIGPELMFLFCFLIFLFVMVGLNHFKAFLQQSADQFATVITKQCDELKRTRDDFQANISNLESECEDLNHKLEEKEELLQSLEQDITTLENELTVVARERDEANNNAHLAIDYDELTIHVPGYVENGGNNNGNNNDNNNNNEQRDTTILTPAEVMSINTLLQQFLKIRNHYHMAVKDVDYYKNMISTDKVNTSFVVNNNPSTSNSQDNNTNDNNNNNNIPTSPSSDDRDDIEQQLLQQNNQYQQQLIEKINTINLLSENLNQIQSDYEQLRDIFNTTQQNEDELMEKVAQYEEDIVTLQTQLTQMQQHFEQQQEAFTKQLEEVKAAATANTEQDTQQDETSSTNDDKVSSAEVEELIKTKQAEIDTTQKQLLEYKQKSKQLAQQYTQLCAVVKLMDIEFVNITNILKQYTTKYNTDVQNNFLRQAQRSVEVGLQQQQQISEEEQSATNNNNNNNNSNESANNDNNKNINNINNNTSNNRSTPSLASSSSFGLLNTPGISTTFGNTSMLSHPPRRRSGFHGLSNILQNNVNRHSQNGNNNNNNSTNNNNSDDFNTTGAFMNGIGMETNHMDISTTSSLVAPHVPSTSGVPGSSHTTQQRRPSFFPTLNNPTNNHNNNNIVPQHLLVTLPFTNLDAPHSLGYTTTQLSIELSQYDETLNKLHELIDTTLKSNDGIDIISDLLNEDSNDNNQNTANNDDDGKQDDVDTTNKTNINNNNIEPFKIALQNITTSLKSLTSAYIDQQYKTESYMYVLLRDITAKVKSTTQKCENQSQDLQRLKQTEENALKTVQELTQQTQQQNTTITTLNNEIQQLNQSLNNAQKQIKSLESNITALHADIDLLQDMATNNNNNNNNMNNQLNVGNPKRSSHGQHNKSNFFDDNDFSLLSENNNSNINIPSTISNNNNNNNNNTPTFNPTRDNNISNTNNTNTNNNNEIYILLLKNKLVSALRDNNQLTLEYNTLKKDLIDAIDTKCVQYQQEYNQLEQRYFDLENKYHLAQNDLVSKKTLENEINLLKLTINDYTNKLTINEQHLDQLNTEYNSLYNKYNDLLLNQQDINIHYTTLQNDYNMINNKLSLLTISNTELTTKYNNKQQEFVSLQSELHNVQHELKLAQHQLKITKNAETQYKQQVYDLQQQNQHLLQETDQNVQHQHQQEMLRNAMQQQQQHYQEQIDTLQHSMNDLHLTLTTKTNENNKLLFQNNEILNQLYLVKKNNKKLQNDNLVLKQMCTVLRHEIQVLQVTHGNEVDGVMVEQLEKERREKFNAFVKLTTNTNNNANNTNNNLDTTHVGNDTMMMNKSTLFNTTAIGNAMANNNNTNNHNNNNDNNHDPQLNTTTILNTLFNSTMLSTTMNNTTTNHNNNNNNTNNNQFLSTPAKNNTNSNQPNTYHQKQSITPDDIIDFEMTQQHIPYEHVNPTLTSPTKNNNNNNNHSNTNNNNSDHILNTPMRQNTLKKVPNRDVLASPMTSLFDQSLTPRMLGKTNHNPKKLVDYDRRASVHPNVIGGIPSDNNSNNTSNNNNNNNNNNNTSNNNNNSGLTNHVKFNTNNNMNSGIGINPDESSLELNIDFNNTNFNTTSTTNKRNYNNTNNNIPTKRTTTGTIPRKSMFAAPPTQGVQMNGFNTNNNGPNDFILAANNMPTNNNTTPDSEQIDTNPFSLANMNARPTTQQQNQQRRATMAFGQKIVDPQPTTLVLETPMRHNPQQQHSNNNNNLAQQKSQQQSRTGFVGPFAPAAGNSNNNSSQTNNHSGGSNNHNNNNNSSQHNNPFMSPIPTRNNTGNIPNNNNNNNNTTHNNPRSSISNHNIPFASPTISVANSTSSITTQASQIHPLLKSGGFLAVKRVKTNKSNPNHPHMNNGIEDDELIDDNYQRSWGVLIDAQHLKDDVLFSNTPIKQNDVILSIAEHATLNIDDYNAVVNEHIQLGKPFTVVLRRDTQIITFLMKCENVQTNQNILQSPGGFNTTQQPTVTLRKKCINISTRLAAHGSHDLKPYATVSALDLPSIIKELT